MIIPRAAALAVKSFVNARDIREEIAEHAPGNHEVETVLKTASSPTSMGSYGAVLGQNAITQLISALAGPSSAFASLRKLGLDLPLMGYASQRIPSRIIDPNDAGSWVAEGASIPSIKLDVESGPTMTYNKVGIIANVTEELAQHSFGIPVIEQILLEAAALQLDAQSLSGNPARKAFRLLDYFLA